MHCFSLAAFRIFFFVFSFQKFNYDVYWHGFFGFILFRVHSASWISMLMSFIKFGKFSVIVSLNAYSFPHSFSFTFWDSNEMNVGYFVIVPQVPEALVIFFPISFPLFILGEFYCSVLASPSFSLSTFF